MITTYIVDHFPGASSGVLGKIYCQGQIIANPDRSNTFFLQRVNLKEIPADHRFVLSTFIHRSGKKFELNIQFVSF
jgi:hypothetical protein